MTNLPPTAATTSRAPGLLRSLAHRLADDDADLPVEGHLASFAGAIGLAELASR